VKILVCGQRWLVEQLAICYQVHQSTMNQFFVVLPSDSSMQFFPDNTVAHYKTKLSERICENGNYEVALTELIYPINYFNFVTKEPLKIKYNYWHSLPNIWEMHSGYYADEEALAEYITSCLTELSAHNEDHKFLYDKTTKKMSYTFEGELVIAGGALAYDDENTRAVVGFYKPFYERFFAGTFDMLAGQRLMYVYSDIVSPYLVGDVKVPLLRVVTPKGKRDEMTNVSFTNPYYLPVVRHGFDTIEININNELGEPMSFTGGKSVAILHFGKTQ
jgi:hypothetical protein